VAEGAPRLRDRHRPAPVSGLNGLAFAASAVLDGLLAGRAVEPAIVAVHLVILPQAEAVR
jgi:hypothetical protein